MNFKERNRRNNYNSKWQKSVAQLMEENGKVFIANENLNKNHPKIKNPDKFKK